MSLAAGCPRVRLEPGDLVVGGVLVGIRYHYRLGRQEPVAGDIGQANYLEGVS